MVQNRSRPVRVWTPSALPYYGRLLVELLRGTRAKKVYLSERDADCIQGAIRKTCIPDVLITDNGTQFTSSEFAKFTETWRFKHNTSSPLYPQSNGKAENAVKVCKVLLRKAKADKKDPLLALLDWQNTPSEGLGTSPVQRLMGPRTLTLLPTHPKLLNPEVDTQTEDELAHRKQMQARRYNKKSQPLPPLQSGAAIRMKLADNDKWSLGSCVKALPNRSYEVEVVGRRYRRNRRQLRMTAEAPPINFSESDDPPLTSQEAEPIAPSQNSALT